MGVLLTIYPKMVNPLGQVFEQDDPYNGPNRGTWWYRGNRGVLFGPFWTRTQAQDHMEGSVPIEPYQDSQRYWWWRDRDGIERGPYGFMRDAEVDILTYANRNAS